MTKAREGQTHWDPVDNESICHEECALAEIKQLRALLEAYKPRHVDFPPIDWEL